jgi:hypothetical protein
MKTKYCQGLTFKEWYEQPIKSTKGSIVWKAILNAFPLVGSWMMWKIGNGWKVRVGEDPWMGGGK